ncbi:MAG TPA: bifunctional phosphopantothenoylcysteine decarboxylase/phosphopantothenate--cysteine ligase CoaBC [Thermoanaerobaculia bacterium]|jgi:phosphopantothenoylcysteine decarboxylase/phosphopantothenate--cysteine ligase|nr:bifunctional phosphopantothenoylcysteine decarboxylase/phosphopantothenate--cysteine ligase CoaBC [Thermoanaerobaculia bacterium]
MNRRPHVLLGVSGGIAAYKSPEVVRRLVDAGADVRVAMTRAAREFVAPLTLAVLSKHEVYLEVFGSGNVPAVDHVELAEWTDVLVVAPATAHTIARLANGLADDFLTTYFLVHRGPVLVAPAMETRMWEHPATRRNLELLAARGARFVGPGTGFLASGREGVGRMAEPEEIAQEAIALATTARRDLEGLRVLVTAGPTRERVDPVRFVSNRSSGRMGYALAESARDRGARVTLLSGPTGLTRPEGMRFVSFETAAELENLLRAEFPECDVLAMAAAVADFIPQESLERLHRDGGERTVRLVPGRDLLAGLRELRGKQTVVAFAAETEDLEERGRRKMESKGADLIAVNDVGRRDVGFDAAENEILLLERDGGSETVSRRSKREVADKIWDAVRKVRSSQLAAVRSQPEPRS